MDKQKHHILAHRGGRVGKKHLLILYPHDKIDYHRDSCEQYAAGHTFAVEHKRERQIDKR